MRGYRSARLAILALALGASPFAARQAQAVEPSAVARPLVDPDELHMLALNIYHEAQGEGRQGMLAVGWVVLNRMRDPAFPKDVQGVVEQGCQFGWLCDDRPDEPVPGQGWRASLRVARELLTEPPADPTHGAMWFHQALLEDPGWGGRIAPSVRIGNHLFYAKASRLPRFKAKPHNALQVAQR